MLSPWRNLVPRYTKSIAYRLWIGHFKDSCDIYFPYFLVLNKLLQQANSTVSFEFSIQVVDALKRFWNDFEVQCYYQHHSNRLARCNRYFLKRFCTILASDYVPSTEDILHARKEKTLAIDKIKFTIEGRVRSVSKIQCPYDTVRVGLTVWFIDVASKQDQRCNTNKCLCYFENVLVVIFIVDLCSYDQVRNTAAYLSSNFFCTQVEEDNGTTNKMHESLRRFRSLCGNRWFYNTSFVLFMNKKDAFAEKITCCSLRLVFQLRLQKTK